MKRLLVLSICVFIFAAHAYSQQDVTAPLYPPGLSTPKPDPVERLGETKYRIGAIQVDTAKREARIPGKMNGTNFLEFIANTKNGFRSYESAMELDTNGITFNVAMILLGLDKDHAVAPKFHFDPNPPSGDPVEVLIEWKSGNGTKRVYAEELLWDKEKKQKFPRGTWVYTGSTLFPDGRYLADQDAVLIGFVHDPSSIIEWTGKNGIGRFGFIQIDPKAGLSSGAPITVIVRATGPAPKN